MIHEPQHQGDYIEHKHNDHEPQYQPNRKQDLIHSNANLHPNQGCQGRGKRGAAGQVIGSSIMENGLSWLQDKVVLHVQQGVKKPFMHHSSSITQKWTEPSYKQMREGCHTASEGIDSRSLGNPPPSSSVWSESTIFPPYTQRPRQIDIHVFSPGTSQHIAYTQTEIISSFPLPASSTSTFLFS